MKSYITILVTVLFVSCFGLPCFAECPSADLTGDCVVDFEDFAIMAGQWLDEGTPGPVGIVLVSINDPGIGGGHESFNGYMSKHETTNAQYCQFLNEALATGDITVRWNEPNYDYVFGASGSNGGADFVGHYYYELLGPGWTNGEATHGGAARINYSGGSFSVDSGFENHPVTYVSWYGATAFCNYYGYRLPTEWEWQAVADYNGSYNYGCGTDVNNSIANYVGSTHPDGTTIVGAFGTYGYGMCDMAGNVDEWTSSCPYSDCSGGRRVLRGGSWRGYSYQCAVSEWGHNAMYAATFSYGFRVCRSRK